MAKVIVVSFKEEIKAIEALHKLKELESFGDITIYDQLMIRKKEDGEYQILKEENTEGWRTLAGMAVGSLVGMLGGPVGFIIGLYAGTAIGAISEISHYDFEANFITKVEKKMEVGTISIIAEIDEDSADFIDQYLQPLDAVILRSDVDFEYDNYVGEAIEDIDDDIAVQRAELKKSVTADKEKIAKKIAELKTKRKSKIAEFEAEGKKNIIAIRDKTTAGIDKLKLTITELGNKLGKSVNEAQSNRLKKRITRQEAKLSSLNHELEVLA